MIGRLLDTVAPRVTAADVVIKLDDTLSLAISPDGDTRVASSRSRTCHLRVLREGRVGHASSTGADPDELIDQVLQAAAAGSELELLLPAPAPLPEVSSRAPQAAAADVATLNRLARTLLKRLQQSGRRVEVWAERSLGSVAVGNTRGVLAGYDVTLAGLGAVVESIGAGGAPPCRVHVSAGSLPTLSEVELLAETVERRLAPRLLERPVALSRMPPVCLAPHAAATFLRPLRAALTGYEAWCGASPLRAKLGSSERVCDERLSLSDDPLAPGRPASRPLDDDGVVSRRLPLLDRGRVQGFLSDLEVGARAGVPATGNCWRVAGSAPRVGFTNLRVAPGVEGRATLLTMLGRGVLVEALEWSGGPNPLHGTLALRAPWSYLVEGGVVRGRLEDVTLSGNVFTALTRLAALGSDASWIGSCCVPSLLIEGLTVSGER